MSKVAKKSNPVIAKPAKSTQDKATLTEVVALLAKGEASEKAAKKKRRDVLVQRAVVCLVLAAHNTGKKHYGLTKPVSAALDRAVEQGDISKRLVTQLCKVIKSDHVADVVATNGDHVETVKAAMSVATDKPLTWRALLDFAEHGGPAPEVEPFQSLIEAFEKLEGDQAEKVILYFQKEFPTL